MITEICDAKLMKMSASGCREPSKGEICVICIIGHFYRQCIKQIISSRETLLHISSQEDIDLHLMESVPRAYTKGTRAASPPQPISAIPPELRCTGL